MEAQCALSLMTYDLFGLDPLQLLVVPLIAAISAGNTVVIKTSELTPATSNVFAKHLNDFMHKSAVAVVEGAVDAAQYLLSQRFDHILFTGSTRVGRIVMKAASANLTPVTLGMDDDDDDDDDVASSDINCWWI